MAKRTPLADRLDQVRARIAAAAEKAGRAPSEITLIAVTKSAAPEQIREILQLGVCDLGESRVQILIQRAGQVNEFNQRRLVHGDGTVPPKVRWHMIGHLQRNKVKALLPLVGAIHSLDSLRLAEEIEAQAARIEKRVPVLLEINAADEPNKHGVAVGAAVHLAEQIDTMPQMQLAGLMAMGPTGGDEAQARRVFARTREVFEEMKWHKIGGTSFKHLSMGMSGDLEAAIAEGATLVRVGTALFGGKPDDHDDSDEKEPPG